MPIIYQAAFNSSPPLAQASVVVNASSLDPLAPATAGHTLLAIGGTMNITSAFPASISDSTAGGNTWTLRYSYSDIANRRVLYRAWQADDVIAGTTDITLSFSNNVWPFLMVLETEPLTFDQSSEGELLSSATTGHEHSNAGITASNVLSVLLMGTNLNADWINGVGGALPTYTRFWYDDTTAAYTRRYALHYRETGDHSADNVPIDCVIAQASRGFVATWTATGGSAAPIEQTPTPDLPAAGAYNQGDAINVDVSGNWTLGSGGVAPLDFTASAEMTTAGLSMSTAGVITGTATYANRATGLTYTVDDAANNGPTTSSPFDYAVADPAPTEDTPTTSPLNATTGQTGSEDISGNWSVGPGGQGPLTFTAGTSPAWPTGLTITADGIITWDGTTPQNTYSALTFDVDDVPGNGPTTSAPFDFVVSAAGAPTVTTAPAVEVDGTGAVIDVRGLTGCVVEAFNSTGARIVRQTGVAQLGNGTFQVQDAGLTDTNHWVVWIEPVSARCGIAYIPAVTPSTDEQSVSASSPAFDYVETLPAAELNESGVESTVNGLTGLVAEAWGAAGDRVTRQTGLTQEPNGRLRLADILLTAPTAYYVAWMDPVTKKCGIEYLPAILVPDQRVTESGVDVRVTEGADRRIMEG